MRNYRSRSEARLQKEVPLGVLSFGFLYGSFFEFFFSSGEARLCRILEASPERAAPRLRGASSRAATGAPLKDVFRQRLQVPSLHAVQRLPVSAIAPVERKLGSFASRNQTAIKISHDLCRTKAPQL